MPIVPLNLIKDREKLTKALDGYAPSWREPISHPYIHRKPDDYPETKGRWVGNQLARRYVNGLLDYDYLMHKINDVLEKIDGGDTLTEPETALMALADPSFKTKMTDNFARTYLKVTPEEAAMLRLKLKVFLATKQNWQAGQGGGTVPGSNTTKDRY